MKYLTFGDYEVFNIEQIESITTKADERYTVQFISGRSWGVDKGLAKSLVNVVIRSDERSYPERRLIEQLEKIVQIARLYLQDIRKQVNHPEEK